MNDKLIQAQLLIDYYNNLMGTRITLNKMLQKNIVAVLKHFTYDDCISVTNFICNDEWHIANGYATLSVIYRPTSFFAKLERAQLLQKDSDLVISNDNAYFGGLEIV